MQFQIPQFIERESKVVGPFTFKQFIYIGTAGAILFIVYFNLPMPVFVVLCFVLGGLALALAFLKIQGQELPTVLKNFVVFSVSPKIFLWKKKAITPRLMKGAARPRPKEKPEEKATALKVTERGHLQRLSAQVETRTR